MSSSVSYHGFTLLLILAFWSFSCEVVNTGSFQQLKCQDTIILHVLDKICEMLHFFCSDLWNEITVCRAEGLEVTSRVTKPSAESSVEHTGITFMISLTYHRLLKVFWVVLFWFIFEKFEHFTTSRH